MTATSWHEGGHKAGTAQELVSCLFCTPSEAVSISWIQGYKKKGVAVLTGRLQFVILRRSQRAAFPPEIATHATSGNSGRLGTLAILKIHQSTATSLERALVKKRHREGEDLGFPVLLYFSDFPGSQSPTPMRRVGHTITKAVARAGCAFSRRGAKARLGHPLAAFLPHVAELRGICRP